jgi:hypothetical protein
MVVGDSTGAVDDDFAVVVTHGYHNLGAPTWFDDTWMFSSATATWRRVDSDASDKPSARYGGVLGSCHTLV